MVFPPFTFSSQNYDFLIICPDKWKDLLEQFKEYKEEHGIKTIVAGLGEKNTPEKLKYFIKEAIEKWGIKYVLLVGGEKFIPVCYSYLNDRSSSWEYERRFPCDLYYADIYDKNGEFASWDTNGNGFYGEYEHDIDGKKLTDEVDLYPDVYLGRLPVRNERELKRVIENIIKYQGSINKNIVLCGGDLYLHDPWDIAEGEYLLDEIAKQFKGCNITKIYASEELNYKKINDAINKGAKIVIFEGAGNHHLWATHKKNDEKWIYYRRWNILQLKNDYLPIIITSGARLAQFNRSTECFNWFFVCKGKAIASIGSTGLCWIGHGKNVTRMFLGKLHILFCKELTKCKFLGEAWGKAIKEYLDSFNWGNGVAKAFHMKAVEEFEIFGDPTLMIGGNSVAGIRNIFYVGEGENYTRIQDAIDNASDGDVIIVKNGTYYEDLFINKSLEIIGEGAKIITNGIILKAPNIKIKNFSIEGYKKGIGLICYGNGAQIEKNKIYFFNRSIFVIGKDCLIRGNLIKNNEYGIWLNKTNGRIEKNIFMNNWFGVWEEYTNNVDVVKNNFSFNEWYGLWVEGKNGKIKNNEFYKNWYSIYLYNSRNFTIINNTIFGNMHGLQFVNSSYNFITKNTIKKNEHYGIYFGWRSQFNKIFSNNFIENAMNARDDAITNKWKGNYWDDYIGIKLKILYLLHFPYYIPKFSFDWHPKISPK